MVYDGAQLTAVHGMTDLFNYAGWFAREQEIGVTQTYASLFGREQEPSTGPAVRVTHWTAAKADVSCVYDSRPGAPHQLAVLVVPASQVGLIQTATTRSFAAWIHARHKEGAILAAACGGVFMLAETGLLDGRPVTTHWALADEFAAHYPLARTNSDKLVIDDGDIITAGGVLAWADLGLRLVERLFGHSVMLRTSRFMLVDPAGREQRFYSGFAPMLDHGDKVIIAIQHWLQTQSGHPVAVATMAKRAGLEERTFLRRFMKATGHKPTGYHQRIRIGKARELLELNGATIGEVAIAVGYEDIGAFRTAFKNIMDLAPSEYRRRFGRRLAQDLALEAKG